MEDMHTQEGQEAIYSWIRSDCELGRNMVVIICFGDHLMFIAYFA